MHIGLAMATENNTQKIGELPNTSRPTQSFSWTTAVATKWLRCQHLLIDTQLRVYVTKAGGALLGSKYVVGKDKDWEEGSGANVKG